jgi:hypothetical protein
LLRFKKFIEINSGEGELLAALRVVATVGHLVVLTLDILHHQG